MEAWSVVVVGAPKVTRKVRHEGTFVLDSCRILAGIFEESRLEARTEMSLE